MSPYYVNSDGSAFVFRMLANGYLGSLNDGRVESISAVRPVINLKADLTITGSGTSTDPYQVA